MTPIRVRVGQGIVEVLQLDDAGFRESLGVTWTPAGRRYVWVSAPRAGLIALRSALQARCGGGWDQPPAYVRSARAAIRVLDRVLAADDRGQR
jgi:hypothetical protein